MKPNKSNQLRDILVDMKTVCVVLCRSRASIYRDIERGTFPAPIKLGHSSRWRMSDLEKIINPEKFQIACMGCK